MTIPPHIHDWLEQDIKARRAKGYTPEQAARMAGTLLPHSGGLHSDGQAISVHDNTLPHPGGWPGGEQAARMAECFERHNSPEIRRDRIGEWIATLRPILWLLLALGATLLALHIFAVTAGNAAAPVTLLY